jgi:hypothetical protein
MDVGGNGRLHGLFFGVMREKTGSVLPGAIAHGLADVLQRVPAFLTAA